MSTILGISTPMLMGQLVIGLINGACYAMLSLGLAVIFGLLNIINFTHAAQYMMGAFGAWMLLNYAGIGYWPALIISPIVVGLTGLVLERLFIRHVYKLDHLYGFLLTFGLTLVIEGAFRQVYGTSGQPYYIPAELQGVIDLGFVFLPYYRVWVIGMSVAVCVGTWLLIEHTRLGAYLRAATENPVLVQAFGINVPVMITLTYGFGVVLAALAGVMVAPIYQVGSLMGSNIIATVFAVVVIGGLSSIRGSIIAGFILGVVEGLTKVFYPEASNTVIFVIMVIILLLKPAGLFGTLVRSVAEHAREAPRAPRQLAVVGAIALLVLALIAPFFLYPIFLMKAMCYALFACAFGFLFGYAGLMSFGHAAFFGGAAYVAGYSLKFWGVTPEIGVLLGAVAGGLLGLVFGWVAIRRHGIYFGMITFSLSQVVYFYAVQARWTHGEDGLQQVPRGHLFGLIDLNHRYAVYYFVLAMFLIGFGILYRTIYSPFGQVLRAIRDNEPRAISLGFVVDRYKLLAFVLSAAIAGMAGATKAIVFQFASLTDVSWTISGLVVLMAILGGVGTKFGPVVGAFVIVAMENYLAEYGSWVTIIQGVVFAFCVLTFRSGLIGELLHYLQRRPAAATTIAGARSPA